MAGQTGPVLFTGNNVDVHINGRPYGFVETITVSRSVNRRPVYAVGSPLFVDAPATQATVTVQATNLVPIAGNNALAGNNVPTGSLLAEVNSNSYPIDIVDKKGNVLYSVVNAFYNNDAVTVPAADILAYNLSWTAQDTSQFAL
ncbi:MAG: hypothetical protein K6T83_03195 [Alicyclobacillus sp.]|nr:hypothetical protein [Alicyclobacillus sp.]